MLSLKAKSIQNITLHIALWVAVWFFYIYFFSYNSKGIDYVLWFSSGLLPVTIIVTYIVIFYLIPKYLLTKKYFLFGLYSFYTFVFSSYIIVLVIYTCLIFILRFNIELLPPMGKNFLFILVLVYLVVGLVSFVNLLNRNFKTISHNKELQNTILQGQLQFKEQELKYLKMQIHPHFLFNTLNTIYGFALQKSEHTPDIILKLSNLLDYILYQVNKPTVSLKEEVLHIKEYIELEKMRFQDTLQVEFSTNVASDDIQVAPMLLIPFIENAFKHGNIIDGALQIKIAIMINTNLLDFTVKNTVIDYMPPARKGIGLENVKKRLEFYFKDKFILEHKMIGNWYCVSLKILKLDSM